MPDTIDAPPTEELYELAGLLGEAVKRIDVIEQQSQPLEATKRAQESALAALNASLVAIGSLRSHVLDNDLGKVSLRLDEVAKQAEVALQDLAGKLEATKKELGALAQDTARQLEAQTAQRTELAQAHAGDVQTFEQRVEGVRSEIGQLQEKLIERIEAARKEFATPRGFNPRGKYAPGVYNQLDVTELNGTSYLSNVDNNTEQPGSKSKNWMTLARRGASANGAASPSADELANLVTLTDGATIAWNLLNPVAKVTLGGARTLTASNLRAGGSYMLHVIQDGTGSRTLTWPSSVKWPGNTAPTLTTTASYRDVFTFTSDGTYLFGSYVQNYPV